jgi:hypothetical protein
LEAEGLSYSLIEYIFRARGEHERMSDFQRFIETGGTGGGRRKTEANAGWDLVLNDIGWTAAAAADPSEAVNKDYSDQTCREDKPTHEPFHHEFMCRPCSGKHSV